jgi:hypothetical protein
MAPNPVFTEKNARRLVNVMAQHFLNGATSEELREKFAIETARKAPETFYAALRHAKSLGWLTGGGGRNLSYFLSPDASWRPPEPPSIGESLRAMERNQLEHVAGLQRERVDKLEIENRRLRGSKKAIANGNASGTAIEALLTIMRDPTVTVRRKIQACEGLLQFKTPEDIANQAKQMLAAIFSDPEQSVDHRLAATTALRKSEDPRIMTPIERPPARTDTELDLAEAAEERRIAMQQRRAHIEKMSVQLEAQMKVALSQLSEKRWSESTSPGENS